MTPEQKQTMVQRYSASEVVGLESFGYTLGDGFVDTYERVLFRVLAKAPTIKERMLRSLGVAAAWNAGEVT